MPDIRDDIRFHDGTPVPADYLNKVSNLITAYLDAEERYGTEEEHIEEAERGS